MAYNISYTSFSPSANTSTIGYSQTVSATVSNIPTGNGTVNIGSSLSFPSSPGVWLVIAQLNVTNSNQGNNAHRLSLSTTSATIDQSYSSAWITNGSNGNPITLQVMRKCETSSTYYLVFQTSAGENNSSGTYTIQYTRIA